MSISVNKTLLVVLAGFLLVSVASASHEGGVGDIGDTGFEVPQYDNQTELVTEFVAPFVFLTLLLHFVLVKVLHFTLRDEDYAPYNPYGYNQDQPNVKRYSIVMSIVITGALVPTVFWNYVVWAIRFLGAASMVFFAGLALFVMYMMVNSGGN